MTAVRRLGAAALAAAVLVAAVLAGADPAGAAGSPVLPPVPVDGGWAYPGRYVVGIDPGSDADAVHRVLDPVGARWWAPVGRGVYLVVLDDTTAPAMERRRADLAGRPGVVSVELDWMVRQGEDAGLPVDPSQVDLAGSAYDPSKAPEGAQVGPYLPNISVPSSVPDPPARPPARPRRPAEACCAPAPSRSGLPPWLVPALAALVVTLAAGLVVARLRGCAGPDEGNAEDMDSQGVAR